MTTTFTAGQMVRDERGTLATVVGYDDRGLLNVTRYADGLAVVMSPDKVHASRVYASDKAA